jgi:hypothetical protein
MRDALVTLGVSSKADDHTERERLGMEGGFVFWGMPVRHFVRWTAARFVVRIHLWACRMHERPRISWTRYVALARAWITPGSSAARDPSRQLSPRSRAATPSQFLTALLMALPFTKMPD